MIIAPRDAALAYARRGWPVLPLHTPRAGKCSCGQSGCDSPGKHPRTTHGLKDATTDETVVRDWWDRWPDGNIGVLTGPISGLVVLDLDVRPDNGINGIETARAIFSFEPQSHFQRTGGGGLQCLFKRPDLPHIRSRSGSGAIAPGVESKADGAYVVVPPSVHSTGRGYEWLSDPQIDGDLPELPPWVLKDRGDGDTKRGACKGQEILRAGERNSGLTSLAGSMRRKGFGIKAIEAALRAENLERCDPPLPDDEVTSIAQSMGRYEPSESPGDDLRKEIGRLASLSRMEYDRVRKAEAKRFGVRPATLDKEVSAARRDDQGGKQGHALDLPEPEPWDAPVDGAVLLDELERTLTRFLALPDGSAAVLALWGLYTHVYDCFDIAPRLAVTSPVKRCGKSRTFDILAHLVPRPLRASNVTPPVVFRTVEMVHPTLFVDEGDTFLHGNEELRGILNSGHSRAGAFVIRTVGEDYEPRQFSTWAPMAAAAIGKLPDTLEDRSISIAMRRRSRGEKVERLRQDRTENLAILARRAARWALDHSDALRDADPAVPDGLHDRAADNWRPLIAIADEVGGQWPALSRQMALRLSGDEYEDQSRRTMVLEDLRSLFAEVGTNRLFSAMICERLGQREDRPWPEFRRGKSITPRQLSKLLQPFGVHPRTVRLGEDTAKGYRLEELQDAFARYLPPLPAVTPPQASIPKANPPNLSDTPGSSVTVEKLGKPLGAADCNDVTDRSPPSPHGGDVKTPEDLNDVWRGRYEERVAIMLEDGQMSREEAEARALGDVLRQMAEGGRGSRE